MNAAVFDTNVLVSGILSPHGPPGYLVEGLLDGWLRAVLDDRILDEYREVLSRPSFGFDAGDIASLLHRITRLAIWPALNAGVVDVKSLPDPDDAPFLICAASAGVPLVTGNLRHFPKKAVGVVSVLSPASFWHRLPREVG